MLSHSLKYININAYKYWILKLLYLPIRNGNIYCKIFAFVFFLIAICCYSLISLRFTPFIIIFIILSNCVNPAVYVNGIPDRYTYKMILHILFLRPLLEINYIKNR